jgi:hypothetical protein
MALLVTAPERRSSKGTFIAIGTFFYFAMTMALYAAITLLHPGTVLDRLWFLNPRAHRDLLMFRNPAGVLFLIVAALAATAGLGWFRRRLWGWRLAVLGISAQLLGNVFNLIRGDLLRGGTGLLIAAALLICLLSDKIKRNFIPAGEIAQIDHTGVH